QMNEIHSAHTVYPQGVSMISVAHNVHGLDLMDIVPRHAQYRPRVEPETHHTSPTLGMTAYGSPEDVPTLLAEVERLRAELQAATARVDAARAEGQASAYQDAADRVARMRWENPVFFWSTYLSISDTLRDLAEQARKVAYAPDTESP